MNEQILKASAWVQVAESCNDLVKSQRLIQIIVDFSAHKSTITGIDKRMIGETNSMINGAHVIIYSKGRRRRPRVL